MRTMHIIRRTAPTSLVVASVTTVAVSILAVIRRTGDVPSLRRRHDVKRYDEMMDEFLYCHMMYCRLECPAGRAFFLDKIAGLLDQDCRDRPDRPDSRRP